MALGIMYDSTTASDIPAGAVRVAGYVKPSGFAWTDADWARFTNAVKVRITPSASVFGPGIHVLDIEPGDASPAQVAAWVRNSRAAGQEGTPYCSMSKWADVIRAIDAAALVHPPYWVAGYPGGGPVLPTITVNGVSHTATAHQYAGSATSGGHYDLSVVAPYWPGVDVGGLMSSPQEVASAVLNTSMVRQGLPASSPLAGGTTDLAAVIANFDAAVNQIINGVASVATQVGAVAGALPAVQAAIIAALPTGDATLTDAQLADLEAKLVAALPGYTVSIAPKPAAS